MPLIGVWAGMVRGSCSHCFLLPDQFIRFVPSPQVAFDIFVLVMVFANAVNRPYRQNAELVHNLYKDGMKFFTVRAPPPSTMDCSSVQSVDLFCRKQALLVMRSVNLLLTIFSTVSARAFCRPRYSLEKNLTDLCLNPRLEKCW